MPISTGVILLEMGFSRLYHVNSSEQDVLGFGRSIVGADLRAGSKTANKKSATLRPHIAESFSDAVQAFERWIHEVSVLNLRPPELRKTPNMV
jgi:hypothetical protein